MNEMDDVGFLTLEEGFEGLLEEIVAVVHLDEVGLVAHGHVLVEEAMDADAGVFVLVEALSIGEGDAGGMAGKDLDIMAAAHEFMGGVERDDFRAGGVIREELVNCEEDAHAFLYGWTFRVRRRPFSKETRGDQWRCSLAREISNTFVGTSRRRDVANTMCGFLLRAVEMPETICNNERPLPPPILNMRGPPTGGE